MAAKRESKTERVVVRLTGQDLDGLRELSEAWGCSLAETARKAIRAAGRVQDMASMGGIKIPVSRISRTCRSRISRGKKPSEG